MFLCKSWLLGIGWAQHSLLFICSIRRTMAYHSLTGHLSIRPLVSMILRHVLTIAPLKSSAQGKVQAIRRLKNWRKFRMFPATRAIWYSSYWIIFIWLLGRVARLEDCLRLFARSDDEERFAETSRSLCVLLLIQLSDKNKHYGYLKDLLSDGTSEDGLFLPLIDRC